MKYHCIEHQTAMEWDIFYLFNHAFSIIVSFTRLAYHIALVLFIAFLTA